MTKEQNCALCLFIILAGLIGGIALDAILPGTHGFSAVFWLVGTIHGFAAGFLFGRK